VRLSKLLDTKILELKGRGDSLRRIAAAVGVSHTTVMRRLKEMEQVSLPGIVPEDVTDKGECNTLSKPPLPRLCGESEDTANQVSHQEPPSVMSGDGVTPRRKHDRSPYRGEKEASHEVCSEIGDLFGAIKDFLESKGIEVYRMQNGGYQVKGNREIVRFYITRRDG
jgi:biotin operon repressor